MICVLGCCIQQPVALRDGKSRSTRFRSGYIGLDHGDPHVSFEKLG
jgi:hypothetical protein